MSSKHSQVIKDKYVGYYIGVESQEQNQYDDEYTEVRYLNIENLTEQLEQDNVYAILRKIHIDWMEETIPEWCIWKVFMSREILLDHCYNLEQINDRVYRVNNPLYITTI